MKAHRVPWPVEFTKNGKLPWRCPSCELSILQLDEASLHEGQTRASVESVDHEAFEPEWIDGRFACLLRCPNCRAGIGVAGTYRVQDDRYYDERIGEAGDYENYYRPRYFSDAPALIPVPDDTPESVRLELLKAFQLFWSDEEACGNRIRRAVEQLLSEEGIRKTTIASKGSRKGRRERLSLHDCIVAYEAKQKELAAALMAVKWIGNAASHAGALTAEDLRDGFELLAYVLDELYVRRRASASRIARDVNRRLGPRSPRRGGA